jgi:hypothetical protein
MSFDQNAVFVQEFFDDMLMLAQQTESVCRGAYRERTINGKSGHFDRQGATSMVRRASRHANTPLVNVPLSRRRVTLDDYDWADLIDNVDELKTHHNMRQEFVKNAAAAWNRQLDDLFIAALNGNSVAIAADDTTSNVTLASWLSGTHVIADGGTNMTMTKSRQANRLLNVGPVDKPDRYMLYSPEAMEKLLSDTQVTSSDFSTINALTHGGFPMDQTWMGFYWRETTRLPKTGNIRSCFAFQKDGMGVAMGKIGQSAKMGERLDKNHATQVYMCLVAGAVRIEEARVIQINIDETA